MATKRNAQQKDQADVQKDRETGSDVDLRSDEKDAPQLVNDPKETSEEATGKPGTDMDNVPEQINTGGESDGSHLTNDENLVLEEDKHRVDVPSRQHDENMDAMRAELEPVAGVDSLPGPQTMIFQRQENDDVFVPAPPLATVTHMTARHDGDAITGHFVDVTGGEWEGRYGVLDYVATVDKKGAPLTGVVVTRDDDAMNIIVDYKDLKRADAGRR